MLRPKHPRVEDKAHLAFVRRHRCAICGTDQNIEAAHLRVGSINHDKESAGMQMKSSDRWAVALCTKHHREQHAAGNEIFWWASYGIDPFSLALSYGRERTE
jgi:hypothetical protein